MAPRELSHTFEQCKIETASRSSKRRKLTHEQSRTQSQSRTPTRLRSQWSRRGRRPARPKHPRPKPPRGNRLTTTVYGRSDTHHSEPTALSFMRTILDKLFIRNKNQHRTQSWWRPFSQLRKATSRLSALTDEENVLKSETSNTSATASAENVRRCFEREAEIRREKELWCEWIREILVPKAYLGVSGLVADQQFAQLGVALTGVLADIVSIAGAPRGSDGEDQNEIQRGGESRGAHAKRLMATSLRATGLQAGEVVERLYDSDDLGEVIERKTENANAERGTYAIQQTECEDTVAAAATNINNVEKTPMPAQPTEKRPLAFKIEDAVLPTIQGPLTTSTQLTRETEDKSNRVREERNKRPITSQSKGKKSKRKNAIDDIFAGLT